MIIPCFSASCVWDNILTFSRVPCCSTCVRFVHTVAYSSFIIAVQYCILWQYHSLAVQLLMDIWMVYGFWLPLMLLWNLQYVSFVEHICSLLLAILLEVCVFSASVGSASQSLKALILVFTPVNKMWSLNCCPSGIFCPFPPYHLIFLYHLSSDI